MMRLFLCLTWLVGGLDGWSLASQSSGTDPVASQENPVPAVASLDEAPARIESDPIPFWRNPNRWSFQAGIGFIARSSIGEMATGRVALAQGDAEGQIYLLQASLKLAALEPRIARARIELDLELPLVLSLVDERGSELFPQFSAGVSARWKTFPWNRWVDTNFETGLGITYSQQVLATVRSRHPDRDRSHLEFYWPLQFTLAHPRHRQHQLALFIHHHSGGRIFHAGGANTIGIGYRLVLENR